VYISQQLICVLLSHLNRLSQKQNPLLLAVVHVYIIAFSLRYLTICPLARHLVPHRPDIVTLQRRAIIRPAPRRIPEPPDPASPPESKQSHQMCHEAQRALFGLAEHPDIILATFSPGLPLLLTTSANELHAFYNAMKRKLYDSVSSQPLPFATCSLCMQLVWPWSVDSSAMFFLFKKRPGSGPPSRLPYLRRR